MIKKYIKYAFFLFLFNFNTAIAQDYFYKDFHPFNKDIPSPEEFLDYQIGAYHTRHDLVVAYMEKLAEISDKATIEIYGRSIENRKLTMLTVSSSKNIKNIEKIKEQHLKVISLDHDVSDFSKLPIFINLAYNVHGNEPSGTEAALLTAYVLIASENTKVKEYLENAIIFIDPTINPDGRDRNTNWVNSFKGMPPISDGNDIEHKEDWPWGRTNHYWFDLNRDLLLAVQPESNARLKWYYNWYPNVVTDFHEMSSYSTFFFEPKQLSASLNPIAPEENYITLNDAFAEKYVKDFDEIGSLYFTKEIYDATYPGYGSTYGDLNGSLSLLFEQASTVGHLLKTENGINSFAFAIRNQFVGSISTIEASIDNKDLLYRYQNDFYKNALHKASNNKTKAYVFGDKFDKNRNKEFIDLLLKHQIEVYKTDDKNEYIVPTKQPKYYMVQTMFETYNKYRDSVFYDASAWSMVNFYNMKYKNVTEKFKKGVRMTMENNLVKNEEFKKSDYAYMIPWDDYYAPNALYKLLDKKLKVKTTTQEFSSSSGDKTIDFKRGALLIPVSTQTIDSDSVYKIVEEAVHSKNVQAYSINSGFSSRGIDLGSRKFKTITKPNIMMLVGRGVSTYESGEVWHLFEQRMEMPIVKVPERIFNKVDIDEYDVIVMVSGSHNQLDKKSKERLKTWITNGNTLITIGTGSSWVIKNKIVTESLIKKDKDSSNIRIDYADSKGTVGKQKIGGAILKVNLDITHPLAYGYHERELAVYKNNRVFLSPAKSRFSTVAKYSENPHIDGYVSRENLDNFLSKSASIIVSGVGKGRVIMFADNPNFRGAWYGTNKLFMNSVFFGQIVKVVD